MRDIDAALALDRFEQHRADVVAGRAIRGEHVDERRHVVEGHVLETGQHRAERHAECGLAAGRKRTETLAVEAARGHHDRRLAQIVGAGEFDRRFDRFRAAIAEEAVLQVARGDQGQRFGQHRAQRIEQILAMQRLALELRAHRGNDLRMTVADVEDAEPAQAVDVLAAAHVGEDVARVRPLHRRVERALRTGLAVFEKSGVDVIAKRLDRFAHDPIRLRAIDRGGGDEF